MREYQSSIIKPRQGFITITLCVCPSVCVCVCVCVCLSVNNIAQKYLTNQLYFWWRPSFWPKDEVIRFWENSTQGKDGPRGVEIWP